jgi:UDP-glucuronate 4-epimerase
MRILLTGAAGFIGSHAAQALARAGSDVVGLDNFDAFYGRASKEANLAEVRSACGRRFSFVEADIRNAAAVADVFTRLGPFDAVVHLAAKAGVRPSIADPAGYEAANVAGTIHLLDAAIGLQPRPRFVFASSSSVYGNAPKAPFSETDNVDFPISPYAATKKAGELVCHAYHHLHGLPVFCLRFFTVYGPRQRPDLAICKFTRSILAGKPIQVFGDGQSSRDYTYVDDVIGGVLAAVDRCSGYEIINLGSERPIALQRMVDTIAAACGRQAAIERLPMQPGDVERTFADVTKARRLLDYRPSMPFDEGVRRQVAWTRERPQESV